MSLPIRELIGPSLAGLGLLFFPLSAISEETKEFYALMAVLDEETETAIKERTNADFLPGIITVLKGEELRRSGVRTVWDALDLVPGFHTAQNNFGELIVGVRGLGYQQHFTFNKVYIDGVAMESSGEQRMAYLTIPVELVERVEVLRGTGGVLFGADATAGVINIITKKEGSAVWSERGSFDSWSFGGRAAWRIEKHEMDFYVAGSHYETDGSAQIIESDPYSPTGNSFAPEPIDDREKSRFFSAGMEWQGLTLEGRYVERQFGDFYGTDAVPPRGSLEMGSDRFWHAGLKYEREWIEGLHGGIKLYGKKHDFFGNEHYLIPAGVVSPLPPTHPAGGAVLAEAYINRRVQEETRWEASTEWLWTGWTNHRLYLLAQYSNLRLDEAYIINPPFVPVRYETWLPSGANRNHLSITIQDQWEVSEELYFTGGFRMEDVEDTGSVWSPQLSVAWQMTNNLQAKLQYTRGFRAPSFLELYELYQFNNFQPRPLTAETVDIVDASIIYRYENGLTRLTTYYQDFRNLIWRLYDPVKILDYTNRGNVISYGLEWETEYNLTEWLKLSGNWAWIRTDDADADRAVPGTQKMLGHIQAAISPAKHLEAVLRWRYVGETQNYTDNFGRVAPPISAYHTTTLLLNVNDWLHDGLRIQAGVNNLFDEDATYLSLPGVLGGGITYPNGLPAHARSVFVKFAWEF